MILKNILTIACLSFFLFSITYFKEIKYLDNDEIIWNQDRRLVW